jgi:hypothetical protein
VRVTLEVSVGELIDRITILELKVRRLRQSVRPAARRELARARAVRASFVARSSAVRQLTAALRTTNRRLWQLEEELRACEREGRFDARFVRLARNVYLVNDRRAALKRRLDELSGSEIRELKSHRLPGV